MNAAFESGQLRVFHARKAYCRDIDEFLGWNISMICRVHRWKWAANKAAIIHISQKRYNENQFGILCRIPRVVQQTLG